MVDIRMPDGKVVRFPDSLTDKQIRGLIVSRYPREAGGTMAAALSDQQVPPRASTGAAPGGGMSVADFGDRLQAFGAALDDAMPPPMRHSGSFPGNRHENGNALSNVLGNPAVAEMLLKKRLSFLG